MRAEGLASAGSRPPAGQARGLALGLVLLGLAVALLVLMAVSMLSAARAYVIGEAQWSRAQKSAVLALHHYLDTDQAAELQRWQAAIAVTQADRRARDALDRWPPDLDAAALGFRQGLNHPDDVPGLIALYLCCRRLPLLAESVALWREADGLIDQLDALAREAESLQGRMSPAQRDELQARLLALDARLTPLQQRFSDSLGDASRRLALGLAVLMAGGSLLAGGLSAVLVRRRALRHARDAQAVARSEALLRSLWETTDDTVLIVGTDNRIRFANPAAQQLFGHPPSRLLGGSLLQLMPERLRAGHEAGMRRHLAQGDRRLDWGGTRILGLHADGRELPVEIRFARIELDGEPLFVGFLRDIGRTLAAERAVQDAQTALEERVQARTRELQQANARLQELDRLKSEFLAAMSHELRTPLNSILGFAGVLLMERPGPLNAEQKRQLGFIRSSGQHLNALISDVLDLSRIESGHMGLQPEGGDLVALLHDNAERLRPLADRKGLALRVQAPAALAWHGDRRKLSQVLLNLVGNAVKFTERGEVVLSLQQQPSGPICIEVRDTGPGIPAEQQPLLFQAFRQLDGGLTRHHEGTGLGLHLTRRLLDLMGGRIEVFSQPGQGSRFVVTLPPAQPGPTSP